MTNSEMNELKFKVARLEALIQDLKTLKDKAREKEETLRKVALTGTCCGAITHFFGSFIHPLFVAATLTAMLVTVAPSGFMMLHYQDKADKYDEVIKKYETEINEAKEKIEFSAEAIFDLTTNINDKANVPTRG